MEDEIRFSHISMEFPGVLANDDISLSIRRGEVFALVGENGAGKSTLMNILTGVVPMDRGQITFRGQPIQRPARHVVDCPPNLSRSFLIFPDLSRPLTVNDTPPNAAQGSLVP